MEEKKNIIEPIIERAEQFSKTSFELFKLKSLDKTAAITSILISRMLVVVCLSLFTLTLNIALALWLGDLLGKSYYGFLIVSGAYALIGIILYSIHPFIKLRINNSIIRQVLN